MYFHVCRTIKYSSLLQHVHQFQLVHDLYVFDRVWTDLYVSLQCAFLKRKRTAITEGTDLAKSVNNTQLCLCPSEPLALSCLVHLGMAQVKQSQADHKNTHKHARGKGTICQYSRPKMCCASSTCYSKFSKKSAASCLVT